MLFITLLGNNWDQDYLRDTNNLAIFQTCVKYILFNTMANNNDLHFPIEIESIIEN